MDWLNPRRGEGFISDVAKTIHTCQTVLSQNEGEQDSRPLPTGMILRVSTLIDGSGADPLRDVQVAVEGDRIEAIGKSTRSSGAQDVRDLDGLTMLPGLIDAHTHLGIAAPWTATDLEGTLSVSELAANIFRNCELALDAGFTTCRDVGGLDGGVVRAIEAGAIRGPRIYPSGPAIVQHAGHGMFVAPFTERQYFMKVPGLFQMFAPCDSPDQVRLASRIAFRRGATQLKLMVTGGVVSQTVEFSQLTVEEIKAAVDEASARNSYVTVHAHNVRGMQNAITAGVKCIEHGTYLDEATAARMSQTSVALVPTLSVNHLMVDEWQKWGISGSGVDGLTSEQVEQLRDAERNAASAIKLAHATGLLIGLGTDILGSDQNRRGLEIGLRARIDGAMEAIVSATSRNAKIMGIDGLVGTVQAGKVADLIAVRGDPLIEPGLFDDPSRVVLVIKGGKIVKDLLAKSSQHTRSFAHATPD